MMTLAEGKHIVIVDDDNMLREEIKDAFEAEGFTVAAFSDAFPFRRHINHRGLPHLAVIDLNLPSIHGFQLSNELKSLGDVPIVFVSNEDASHTVIEGIERYADDYVRKPFEVRELVVRVQRILSRIPDFNYANAPIMKIDDWLSIDFARSCVLLEDEREHWLTPTEVNLLYILVNNEGQIVPSDLLLARVWRSDEVFEDTLRVHIHRLRRKIEPDHRHPRYIQTVRGTGYCFVAPVADTNTDPLDTLS